MKHIAAVLLLALGGQEINEANSKKVLDAAGAKPNEDCIKLLLKNVKGKKCEDIIKEGAKKLGGVVAAGAAAGAGDKKDDHKGKKDNKKEDKKKKKEEPKKEESDDDADLGGLF